MAHADLDLEIRQLADSNRKFYEQATKFTEIVNKADTLRTQRDIVERSMNSSSTAITELSCSDKELQSQIDHHKEQLDQQRLEQDDAKRQKLDEEDSLAAFERKRSAAQTARGKLEAEKQRHKEVIDYRHRLIRDLSVKHEIPGFDHNLSQDEMDDFVDRLEQAIVTQSTQIDHLKVGQPLPSPSREHELRCSAVCRLPGVKKLTRFRRRSRRYKRLRQPTKG